MDEKTKYKKIKYYSAVAFTDFINEPEELSVEDFHIKLGKAFERFVPYKIFSTDDTMIFHFLYAESEPDGIIYFYKVEN